MEVLIQQDIMKEIYGMLLRSSRETQIYKNGYEVLLPTKAKNISQVDIYV